MLRLYSKYFKSCFLLRYEHNRQMLICTQRPDWTWEKQRRTFLKHLAAIDDRFEFHISYVFKNL